jgi:2-polyprenyl-6-methoxyphenol hydroxylase-like FAD-dependent oxidoreductase
MTEQSGNDTQVLVVGAGSTGLMMASELSRHGVSCRIVDKALAPSDKSKAVGVQARTLEVFEDMGVLKKVKKLSVQAIFLLPSAPYLLLALRNPETK